MNEHTRNHKDVMDRRVVLNLSEAGTLNKVQVKLEVDFDSILKLQRKIPEYGEKRIQNVLPLMVFDDYKQECEVLK